MGFTNRIIIINEELYIWIAQFVDFSLGFGNCAWIIFTANGDDLHEFFRIIEIIDFLDCLAVDILLVLGRQKNSKSKTRIAKDSWSMVQPRMFGFLPDEQTQAYIKDGLKNHKNDEQKVDYQKDLANNRYNHLLPRIICKVEIKNTFVEDM